MLENERVVVFHVPPPAGETSYLGHLLVTPRRHCPDFAGLDRGEAEAVGVAIAVCSAALKAIGAERVYVATVGHSVAHLHVHLLPRWPGTPRTSRGTRWMNGHRRAVARRREIASLVASLRPHIEGS